LENQFPPMSGIAFAEASRQMLAAGQSVLQTDGGVLYEFFPDGSRRRVKDMEPATPVTLGQRRVIR